MTRLAAILCLLAFPAFAYTVVDGDTLKDDQGLRLRIIGLDAPEIRGKCDYEKELARMAKRYVEHLYKTTEFEIIDSGKHDRYQRPLVHVLVNGESLAEIMIARGLARAYVCDPRCPKRRSWCD